MKTRYSPIEDIVFCEKLKGAKNNKDFNAFCELTSLF